MINEFTLSLIIIFGIVFLFLIGSVKIYVKEIDDMQFQGGKANFLYVEFLDKIVYKRLLKK